MQLEVRRKDGQTCHEGSIQQLMLDEGELITIGVDGYVRVSLHDKVSVCDVWILFKISRLLFSDIVDK